MCSCFSTVLVCRHRVSRATHLKFQTWAEVLTLFFFLKKLTLLKGFSCIFLSLFPRSVWSVMSPVLISFLVDFETYKKAEWWVMDSWPAWGRFPRFNTKKHEIKKSLKSRWMQLSVRYIRWTLVSKNTQFLLSSWQTLINCCSWREESLFVLFKGSVTASLHYGLLIVPNIISIGSNRPKLLSCLS